MVASAQNSSPELRMAIAGLGAAGCMMIPAMVKNPKVRITAAADLDEPSLDKFHSDFQAEVYGDVEALCQSPNVDAIYISTPTQLHTQHVLMALENGEARGDREAHGPDPCRCRRHDRGRPSQWGIPGGGGTLTAMKRPSSASRKSSRAESWASFE